MQTQIMTYGTATFTGYNAAGTRREYIYHSNVTGGKIEESALCLGPHDTSEIQTGSPTVAMRENCHCCFAGYSHTVALCNARNSK